MTDNMPYVESKDNTFKAFVVLKLDDELVKKTVILKTNIGLIE